MRKYIHYSWAAIQCVFGLSLGIVLVLLSGNSIIPWDLVSLLEIIL